MRLVIHMNENELLYTLKIRAISLDRNSRKWLGNVRIDARENYFAI